MKIDQGVVMLIIGVIGIILCVVGGILLGAGAF